MISRLKTFARNALKPLKKAGGPRFFWTDHPEHRRTCAVCGQAQLAIDGIILVQFLEAPGTLPCCWYHHVFSCVFQ